MSQSSGYQGGRPTPLPVIFPAQVSNGSTAAVSPAQSVLNFPRVAGTVTVTVGGTEHDGDVLNVNIANGILPNGSVSVSYTLPASATVIEGAQGLAAAICNNSVLQQHDIFATSLGAVVTISQLGPLSLASTVTASVTGSGHTTTLTVAASGKLAGGSGAIIPLAQASIALNGATVNLNYGIPVILPTAQVLSLAASSVSAK